MHYVKTPTPTNERMDDTLTPLAMRKKMETREILHFSLKFFFNYPLLHHHFALFLSHKPHTYTRGQRKAE